MAGSCHLQVRRFQVLSLLQDFFNACHCTVHLPESAVCKAAHELLKFPGYSILHRAYVICFLTLQAHQRQFNVTSTTYCLRRSELGTARAIRAATHLLHAGISSCPPSLCLTADLSKIVQTLLCFSYGLLGDFLSCIIAAHISQPLQMVLRVVLLA